MNAVADTTQANRTSLFDAPWIDGIEAELAKLYRSLPAHQGGLAVEQSSRRCSVESAIDDLIAWMASERGLSQNYCKSTQVSLERFARWMEETRPKQAICDIRTAELSAYLASEKKRGLAPASLKLITVAIKILFRRLKNRAAIKHDPSEVLRVPRVKSRLPEVLNKEEVTQLLAADLTGRPYPLRDRAMLELFYSSGLRLNELTSARLENLSLPERVIRVIGKGNKTRLIPVNHAATRAIEEYLAMERDKLAKRSTAPEIFLSDLGNRISNQAVWRTVKEIGIQTGIKKRIYPHLLRHAMATHLLMGGADLRVIQSLLGHANLSTTQVYTHVDVTQKRKVIREFHPHGTLQRATA
jgi:integrase/recombinase XerD